MKGTYAIVWYNRRGQLCRSYNSRTFEGAKAANHPFHYPAEVKYIYKIS
jgi:hypothetical protein